MRSAARAWGRSFASTLNWSDGDYAMSHLARAALAARQPEVRADLLSGKAEPRSLLPASVRASLHDRAALLPSLLAEAGASIVTVAAARMKMRFDLDGRRTLAERPEGRPAFALPFELTVTVVDDRGDEHVAVIRQDWVATENPAAVIAQRRWWPFGRRAD